MEWHNRDFEDLEKRLNSEYKFRFSLTPEFKRLYVALYKWINLPELIEINSGFPLKIEAKTLSDEDLYLLLKPLIEDKIKKIEACLKPNE